LGALPAFWPPSIPMVLLVILAIEIIIFSRQPKFIKALPDRAKLGTRLDIKLDTRLDITPNVTPDPSMVAVRLCARPPKEVQKITNYQTPSICRTLAFLGDGPWACSKACLGLGDCIRACPFGAISRAQGANPDDPPLIDPAKCCGCGACQAACPRSLMVLRPTQAPSVVKCRGTARMKAMDRLCPKGCLGCGKCRKACPAGAVGRPGPAAPPVVDFKLCQAALSYCNLSCRLACPRGLPNRP
jgi:electron transport complex protein RnfB